MKKLSLTRETLHCLSSDQVALAVGAAGATSIEFRTAPHSANRPNCRESRLKCWVSELYSVCCPTTQSLAVDCTQL